MTVSEKYKLSKPFFFFEEISKIPHGSGNMKGISNFCKKFAEDRGLKVIQDKDLNLLIFKEATVGYENQDTIILQGHMDMVCEKVPSSAFDFEKDGIEIQSDGVNIWANGTTLGGDNGIAIAMSMAIMDDDKIQHGPLEFIFTVDEENGLNGAKSIDLSPLKGKKLINLDSEDDTTILTSCAGGANVVSKVPMLRESVSGIMFELVVDGMKGGHSGIEIGKEHGNSNVLMGRIIDLLGDDLNLHIVQASGGKVGNVITSRTAVKLIIEQEQEQKFSQVIEQITQMLKKEYVLSAPDLVIVANKLVQSDEMCLTPRSVDIMVNLLMNMPNGVQSMSLGIPGMVETSLNMGVMNLNEEYFEILFSVRSSVASAKEQMIRRITAFTELVGGSAELLSEYPGWEYRVDSELRDKVAKVYSQIFTDEANIGAIHAGLECGLLADKVNDLDCISIGPNLKDVHSVNESMNIESVEKVWKLLKEVLADKQ